MSTIIQKRVQLIRQSLSLMSESQSKQSIAEEKQIVSKIFVTNLDGEQTPVKKLEEQLRQRFAEFGQLESVTVKRSYNGQYSFAFIEYKQGEDAAPAVQRLNGQLLCNRKMRVELQQNSRRRKGTGQGCYVCGKSGHFARECRSNDAIRDNKSRSKEKKKSSKKRHYSSSSSPSRSRSHKKKQKKKHSEKHKSKKHSKKSKKQFRSSDQSN